MNFPDFFRALHGHAPSAWQERLALALRSGSLPRVTVPTGMGKSAALDAAVWAAFNTGWRRILFVVDRRLVVDEVYQRALHIQSRLSEDARFADFCARIGELQVVRLRGGVFGDDDWVLFPDRLSIVLSTVDQVGSRLLNRGYGVSPRRWPLHAGFFSCRSLLVVDEAHLSAPFLRTLATIQRNGADISVLPMSATLAQHEGPELSLQPEDIAEPLIARRFHARKLARILEVPDRDFVKQAVASARELGLGQHGRRIAVVVNRVSAARAVYDQLARSGENVILVIGRCRAIDRDDALAAHLPALKSGRVRSSDAAALCVVATQTIEVGADFDFDALVTECAALSALRQRFGRLDRLGELGSSNAHVIARVSKRGDPVYGEAAHQALAWLRNVAEHEGVDMGLAGFQACAARVAPPLDPEPAAVSLLPAHLDLLAQSGPYAPQLDVAAWLHGAQPRRAEVSLVWRADLPTEDATASSSEALERWIACVTALPPMRGEALDMPIAAVRNWLLGHRDDSLSDLSGDQPGERAAPARTESDGPVLLRWRGADDSELIHIAQARPGDTLVLPSALGGCDAWGWAPESTAVVEDRAEECRLRSLAAGARGGCALRLWPGRHGLAQDKEDQAALDRLIHAFLAASAALEAAEADEAEEDAFDVARSQLDAWLRGSTHAWVRALGTQIQIVPYPGGVLVGSLGIVEERGVVETGVAVSLDIHHLDVARWAQRLGEGHPDQARIVAAAAIHDEGKRDRRMQLMLHGNALSAEGGPVLAKSGLANARDRYAAWRASGLPRGFRHELASLVYAAPTDALVSHLVGSHHGFGRPWFVPCVDRAANGAALAALGSGWLAQFAAQQKQLGLWALAEREWLLRAADARASIEEAGGGLA